jgi:positive regulator of sigma E activity
MTSIGIFAVKKDRKRMAEYQEKGHVQQIIDEKSATVVLSQYGECNTCAAKGSCHGLSSKKPKMISVHHSGDLKVGDAVVIGVEPRYRVAAALLVFLLPLLSLFGGYFAGKRLFPEYGENALIGSAFAGLLFAFGIVALLLKFVKGFKKFIPLAVKSHPVPGKDREEVV